jgi:hypothetical protein
MKHSRRTIWIVTLLSVFAFAALAVLGCGEEEGNGGDSNGIVRPKPDTIPPATVVDLRIKAPSIYTLALVWTSPGDDGGAGSATRYDIRYSDAPITQQNWDQAVPLDQGVVPAPRPGGQVETIVVEDLTPGSSYHFALMTADEVPNWSGVSNSASGTTLGEIIPPADVTDLSVVALDFTSFELTFTAPGDDGTEGRASEYDIRYSTVPIEDETDWYTATQVQDVPAPGPAGEVEQITVTGLGNSDGYFFVLRTADELGNWSGMSNPAIGMKYGNSFWVFPKNIDRGENLYIVFETSTTDTLAVTSNGAYVPRVCNIGVIDVIARDAFSDGIHTLTYDFINQETGEHYPPGSYWIAICNGQESVDMDYIELH